MRNIQRLPIPKSLQDNSIKWRDDLLDEIERCAQTGERVAEKFYNKYKKKGVRRTLSEMYDDLCCFCESELGVTDYSHIEHLKPKRSKNGIPVRPFPELTYDWNNLNLVCGICNTSKGTKYDYENPILDPTDNDTDIEKHLSYKRMGSGLYRSPLSNRARTTVKHANLNREKLRKKRLELWGDIVEIILEIKADPSNPTNEIVKEHLLNEKKGQYGSIYLFLIKKYLQ